MNEGPGFFRGFARWIDALPAGVVFALALGAVCRVDCEMSSSGSAATAVEIVRPAPQRNH